MVTATVETLNRGRSRRIPLSLLGAMAFVYLLSLASIATGDVVSCTVLSGVPDYPNYHGCAATSGGMIIAYWDQFPEFENLFYGDASVWNTATREMVASQAFIDAGNTWEGHDPTSLADFMHTVGIDTAPSYIPVGLVNYADWDDPETPVSESYDATASMYYDYGGFDFDTLESEIDAGRPMVLALKAPNKGHALVAYGYREDTDGSRYYAVRDTWRNGLTWAPPGAIVEDGVEWWVWKLFTGVYAGDWDWQVQSGVSFVPSGGAPPTYSISGTVTNAGDPLEGVEVSADGYSNTTAADGTYTIDELPAGTYTVTPSKGEYTFEPASRDITVNQTEGNATGVDFVGTEKTYSISGTVTNAGDPLEGVEVSADGHSDITGPDGTYAIAGLTADTYTVTPSKAEYSFEPESSEVTVNETEGNATGVDFVGTRVYSHTYPAGLTMMGIPVDASGASSMEDLTGAQEVVWWDPELAGYVTIGAPTPYVLARGYWGQFDAATEVVIGGAIVAGPVDYPVKLGWNIICVPYLSEVGFDGVGPAVRRYAWTDQGSGYELVALIEDGLNLIQTTLQPWLGYWVYADADGLLTLTETAGSSQIVKLSEGGSQADGWQMQLVAKAGDRTDAFNFCGVADEATAQALTIANPPAVSGSVDLYFPRPSGPMATDIRSIGEGDLTWNFEVRSGVAGAEVTIGYPDLSVVPNAYRLVLTDLDAGKSIQMRTTRCYSYNPGPEAETRHFRIAAELKSATALLVTGVAAQQVSSQSAAISYSLSAAAHVSVEIRNIAGRLVRQVKANELEAAGANTALWSLTNATGSRVPSGTYLCVVTARTDEGQVASQLRTLAVRR